MRDTLIRDWFSVKNSSLLPQYVEYFLNYIDNEYGYAIRQAVVEGMGNNWEIVNDNGKLSTRIGAVLAKNKQPAMPNRLLDILSRCISQSPGANVEYRITDDLGWKPGDYSDYGSCFFSFNRRHRANLVELGSLALQSRNKETKVGNGRAWLTPIDDHILMFNKHGAHQSYERVMLSVLGDGYVSEYGGDLRLSVNLGGNKADHSFYQNGDLIRFIPKGAPVPQVIDRPHAIRLDGCRCARVFNNLPADGASECSKCPFSDEERTRFLESPEIGVYSDRVFRDR